MCVYVVNVIYNMNDFDNCETKTTNGLNFTNVKMYVLCKTNVTYATY